MRVLVVSYHLPLPEQIGAVRPWNEVRLFRDLGCEVEVLTSGVHYLTGDDLHAGSGLFHRSSPIDGVTVVKLRGVRGHRTSLAKRLQNYLQYGFLAFLEGLRSTSPDIVFVGSDPLNVAAVGWVLARLRRARFVLDERDLNPETAIALGVLQPGMMTQLLHKVSWFLRRRADHVVAATPGLARYLRQALPGTEVSLLLNADYYYEVGEARPVSTDLEDPIVAGYAGGLGMANDVGTIIEAANILRDNADVCFSIMGAGEMLDVYVARVDELGLSNVEFLPPLPREEARRTIGSFDIALQPLKDHAHFEMTLASKLFEYLALGVPVSFSGNGDGEQLLADSGGGVSTPPEDAAALAEAIAKLAASPSQRRALSDSGLRWYREEIRVDNGLQALGRSVVGGGS